MFSAPWSSINSLPALKNESLDPTVLADIVHLPAVAVQVLLGDHLNRNQLQQSMAGRSKWRTVGLWFQLSSQSLAAAGMQERLNIVQLVQFLKKPNEAKANKLLLLLYGNFVLIHEKIGIWKGWFS